MVAEKEFLGTGQIMNSIQVDNYLGSWGITGLELGDRFRQHAQKVSGSAEEKGLNIIQDHEIYRLIAPELSLTGRDKHVICGYHWKATQRPTVSEEGRASAIEAWSAEPEFGRLSFLMYLLQRAKDKC